MYVRGSSEERGVSGAPQRERDPALDDERVRRVEVWAGECVDDLASRRKMSVDEGARVDVEYSENDETKTATI